MLLSKDISDARYQIKAYEPGVITVNEIIYRNSIILSSDTLIDNWPPRNLDSLTQEDQEQILQLTPEVILLGTGRQFIMPKDEQISVLRQCRIGFESMDTGAACRTFVALASEGRQVVAALLID